MINRNVITIAWLIFSITGCTTHLPGKGETIHYPNAVRSGQKYTNSQQRFSADKWWLKLHDVQLNHLIQTALANNYQIKSSYATLLQAQSKLKETHANWLPTLDVSANTFFGGTWNSSMTPKGVLARNPLFTSNSSNHFQAFYGGFTPGYSLNVLANLYHDKYAEASVDLQVAAHQAVRLGIISQVTGSYFMLLGQREQLSILNNIIKNLTQLQDLELTRYHEGASDMSAVNQVKQQLANTRANLATVKSSIAELENTIQLLLNNNPGAVRTTRSIHSLSIKGLVPVNLPSSVLKNRPDIMQAEQTLKIAEANLGIAYASYFPNINLTGLLGGTSLDLARLLKLSTGLWIAQAAISAPLLNGKYYQHIKGEKAGYQSAYYAYLETLKSAFAEVDNSLTNLKEMTTAFNAQKVALSAAADNMQLSMTRYHAGANDYREVIQSRLTVANAKLDQNLAKMQQLDSLVQVYQALAGGCRGDARQIDTH